MLKSVFRLGAALALLFGLMGGAQAAPLGDVTGDGKVGVEDAVKLLRFAVRLEIPTDRQAILGDVYPFPGEGRVVGDQRLNIQDAIQVLRFTVGLISRDDFGVNTPFLALTPRNVVLGPSDQVQFTAVPVNFETQVTWSKSGGGPNNGALSVTGLYIAPNSLNNDLVVTIRAQAGGMEETAVVDVTDIGPPPPPPI